MGALASIGLGTAQFGFDYGVSNRAGRVPESQVARVLELALRHGIRVLDTASVYGDSEAVLGRVLAGRADFAVVTKTTPSGAADGAPDLETIAARFHESLTRLRLPRVYGLLVHHGESLLRPGGDALYARLTQWKHEGLVQKVGASVYDPVQALQLAQRFPLDLVQLPLNVFDQRADSAGVLSTLHQRGIEVHARSVFLQGLLLMGAEELPTGLQRFAARLQAYRSALLGGGCSPLEGALGFARAMPGVDVVLVGVTSDTQLQECIAAYRRGCGLDLKEFACTDEDLIDPRRWSSP
jgi:aryl-alcohol dehydrogenase-like predicted oxidoreductase